MESSDRCKPGEVCVRQKEKIAGGLRIIEQIIGERQRHSVNENFTRGKNSLSLLANETRIGINETLSARKNPAFSVSLTHKLALMRLIGAFFINDFELTFAACTLITKKTCKF